MRCEYCGDDMPSTFTFRPSSRWLASRRFCSRACLHASRKGRRPREHYEHRDPVERFWEKVSKNTHLPCWQWIGYRDAVGYGLLYMPGGARRKKAHRFSWEIHHGWIPEGSYVLHRCDNPWCVNPDHLFLGSLGDNNRDRAEKGRNGDRSGEKNGRTVLADRHVEIVRDLYTHGGYSQQFLADQFGVSQAQVSRIVRGVQRKR